jgi:hypothetical protein
VPSQHPQGQLQTQHSVDTSNYFMDKYNINSKTNYSQALEEKHIIADKYTNTLSNNNNNFISTNLSCYCELRNVKYKYLEAIIIIIIIIQFDSCLYKNKFNSSEADYKVGMST